MKYLNEEGLRIGADVSLIGFDDIGTFPYFGLQISTIERPMQEMGEKAFELLWERITHGKKVNAAVKLFYQRELSVV